MSASHIDVDYLDPTLGGDVHLYAQTDGSEVSNWNISGGGDVPLGGLHCKGFIASFTRDLGGALRFEMIVSRNGVGLHRITRAQVKQLICASLERWLSENRELVADFEREQRGHEQRLLQVQVSILEAELAEKRARLATLASFEVDPPALSSLLESDWPACEPSAGSVASDIDL